jgi:O-acetylserine/cysteine efflux transporter
LLVEGPGAVIRIDPPVGAEPAVHGHTAVLASLFGYGVWNSLMGRHRAAEVAPYSLLVPVVGMTAALVFAASGPVCWPSWVRRCSSRGSL